MAEYLKMARRALAAISAGDGSEDRALTADPSGQAEAELMRPDDERRGDEAGIAQDEWTLGKLKRTFEETGATRQITVEQATPGQSVGNNRDHDAHAPLQAPASLKKKTTRVRIAFEDKAAWLRERHSDSVSGVSPPVPSFAETHYSVGQIADIWNLSSDAVRSIFHDEPGVLVIGGQRVRNTRRYATLRIPESVLQRVHRRMSIVARQRS